MKRFSQPLSRKFFSFFHYVQYLLGAVTEHRIHSPFVFRLVTQAIRCQSDIPRQACIEACRQRQLANHRLIEVTDLGTAYGGSHQYVRSVSSIARHSSRPRKYVALLYRLAHWLQPKTIIELGTSFGYSTMYMAGACPDARVITIEGCPNTAAIARENFLSCQFENIEIRIGHFDDHLPAILHPHVPDMVFIDGNHQYESTLRYFDLLRHYSHENTVLIFDDIYWSADMKKAWDEIRAHPDVTVSLDVFTLGMLFFRKGIVKQHFRIRY